MKQNVFVNIVLVLLILIVFATGIAVIMHKTHPHLMDEHDTYVDSV